MKKATALFVLVTGMVALGASATGGSATTASTGHGCIVTTHVTSTLWPC